MNLCATFSFYDRRQPLWTCFLTRISDKNFEISPHIVTSFLVFRYVNMLINISAVI